MKILELGLIEVMTEDGAKHLWTYKSLKELKELKNAMGVESWRIVRPLTKES